MHVVKDTSKYRANRIIFDSDSDDDDEAIDGVTQPVQDEQPDKQVQLIFILLLTLTSYLLVTELLSWHFLSRPV